MNLSIMENRLEKLPEYIKTLSTAEEQICCGLALAATPFLAHCELEESARHAMWRVSKLS
jgi:hypothetical protein